MSVCNGVGWAPARGANESAAGMYPKNYSVAVIQLFAGAAGCGWADHTAMSFHHWLAPHPPSQGAGPAWFHLAIPGVVARVLEGMGDA